MKKDYLLSFTILAVSLLLIHCKADTGSDTGGGGADFDATQYYTKTQIDSKLNDINAALSQPLKFANETVRPISGLGYENGTSVWSIPSGYGGVIFQIVATNADIGSTTINVHFADGTNSWGNGQNWSTMVTVPGYSSIQVPGIVSINSASGGVKAWLDASSGWNSNLTVQVAPVYWIK